MRVLRNVSDFPKKTMLFSLLCTVLALQLSPVYSSVHPDDEKVIKTRAIYRCPAKEAETDKLDRVVDELGFDTLCIDPTAGPTAKSKAKGKMGFISPTKIDTLANLKWRNAIIKFTAGHISPAEWLKQTHGLGETIHFLSSPKTPELRDVTQNTPNEGSTYSGPAVFSEHVLLMWPGLPCLTMADTWSTRELPGAGKLQSWVLAMNDWLGPLLLFRSENPAFNSGKPEIIRADKKPGLLIFRLKDAKKTITVYFNNGRATIPLPGVKPDHFSIHNSFDMEGNVPGIYGLGTLIDVDEKNPVK